ncbi:hypothetical protein Pla123a_18050 [Posidoniimonas polymericola]|uniref:Nickel uptake substrate-specific transmembrane region n=1 Tax=Posidoniimonas polymericola TaxID=2528002 RepID=A0A5C5YSS2_9BACT|nr:carboxypeptidase-like regulatory domain-containing protein [Posidoniimonas polymericola]TWT78005.1 hypothetical protein Pla123a_18050 [Posidoniimonas polymericola]
MVHHLPKTALLAAFLTFEIAAPLSAHEAEKVENPLQTARVRVVDSLGEPIANVTVAPWAIRSEDGHGSWRKDGLGQSEPPTVTTDADGRAEFQYPMYASPSRQVACQAITCRVEHPGYADTVYNDVPVPQVGEPTTIEMLEGAKVGVKPLGEDMAPFADGVYAMWSDDSYGRGREQVVWEGDTLSLPRIQSGEELIRLVRIDQHAATHFSPPLPFVLTEGQVVDLVWALRPAVSVRGVLSDNVPRPVKNGRVSATVIAKAPGDNWENLHWTDWAAVAEDGTFELSGLPAGEPLQIIALCDGYIAASGEPPAFVDEQQRQPTSVQMPQVFDLPPEGQGEITLEMEPSGTCEFTVQDAKGQPVVGIGVVCWPNVKWWDSGSQMYCDSLIRSVDWVAAPAADYTELPNGVEQYENRYRDETDAQGRAVLANIPVGAFRFRIAEARGVAHQYQDLQGQADAAAEGGKQSVTLKPKP